MSIISLITFVHREIDLMEVSPTIQTEAGRSLDQLIRQLHCVHLAQR